jgi:TP901 family phage tail tape measure protein
VPVQTLSIRITETGAEIVGAHLDKLDRKARTFGESFKKSFDRNLSSPSLPAIFTAGGIAAAAKRVLEFDTALGQLQADARMTTTEAQSLRDMILSLADAQHVEKEQSLEGIQMFQTFGGIVRQMLPTYKDLATIHKATGADMKDLAAVQSTLFQTLGQTPEEAIKSIATFNEQARAGQTTLREIANVIPGLMAGGKVYGFTGDRAVKQLGTMLQVAVQGIGPGKSGEAMTASLAFLRDLRAHAARIKKDYKIDIFSDKQKHLKDIDWIVQQLYIKTKGVFDLSPMSKRGAMSGRGLEIFSDESRKLVGVYSSALDKAGNWIEGKVQRTVGAAEGDLKTIEAQRQLKQEGIARDAAKMHDAFMALDTMLMRHGAPAIAWFADNVYRGGVVFIGAMAGIKLSAAAIAALNTSLLRLSTSSMGTVGALAGVLALGYAIGTLVDEVTGASDAISNAVFNLLNPGEQARRARGMVQGVASSMHSKWGAEDAARPTPLMPLSDAQLATQRRKRAEELQAEIQRKGEGMGLNSVQLARLAPELSELIQVLKSKESVHVSVKQPGLDAPKVALSRGPSWTGGAAR